MSDEYSKEMKRIRLQSGLNALLLRESANPVPFNESEIDAFEFAYKKGFDNGYAALTASLTDALTDLEAAKVVIEHYAEVEKLLKCYRNDTAWRDVDFEDWYDDAKHDTAQAYLDALHTGEKEK